MSKEEKCEICGQPIGKVKFIYTDPEEKVKMVVCPDCANREEEVSLKWREKLMLSK